MQVARPAFAVGELTEQQGAPVTEPGHEPTELMAGVRLGGRRCPLRHVAAEQQSHPGSAQPVGIEAQFTGEDGVQDQQPRFGCRLGLPAHRQFGEVADEPVLQRDTHPIQPTERAG